MFHATNRVKDTAVNIPRIRIPTSMWVSLGPFIDKCLFGAIVEPY